MKTSADKYAAAWWLNPMWFVVVTILPCSFCAWAISSSDYQDFWHCTKNFKDFDLGLMCVVVLAFLSGAFIAQLAQKKFVRGPIVFAPNEKEENSFLWPLARRFFNIGLVVTVLAYSVWLASGFAVGLTPDILLGVLRGNEGAIYQVRAIGAESSVSGLTTATQFGMAVALLGTLLACRFGWRTVRWRMGLLLLLSACRAVFFSERLALIEVVVPPLILWFQLKIRSRDDARSRLVSHLLPIIGVAGVFTLFTATEYFRSWVNYYSGKEESMLWHSFMRLLGYYVTALNNGTYLFETQGLVDLPYYTMLWLWKFPFVSFLWGGFREWEGEIDHEYSLILKHYANPEFNNPSGIYVTFIDFGVSLAMLAWVVAGFIGMILYLKFQRGTLSGLLLYPFYFLGLTELTRGFYWGDTRAFPSWALLLLFIVMVHTRRRSVKNSHRPWARSSITERLSVPSAPLHTS